MKKSIFIISLVFVFIALCNVQRVFSSDDLSKINTFDDDFDLEKMSKQLYLSEISKIIHRNWFCDPMDLKEDLLALVVVKIHSNGEIVNIWFDRKSGSELFDDSIKKAIRLSSPLPAFPESMGNDSIEIGLRFIPFDE